MDDFLEPKMINSSQTRRDSEIFYDSAGQPVRIGRSDKEDETRDTSMDERDRYYDHVDTFPSQGCFYDDPFDDSYSLPPSTSYIPPLSGPHTMPYPLAPPAGIAPSRPFAQPGVDPFLSYDTYNPNYPAFVAGPPAHPYDYSPVLPGVGVYPDCDIGGVYGPPLQPAPVPTRIPPPYGCGSDSCSVCRPYTYSFRPTSPYPTPSYVSASGVTSAQIPDEGENEDAKEEEEEDSVSPKLHLGLRHLLSRETRRRWVRDLFRVVFGYGLLALGITGFCFGLLYLYDADLTYNSLVDRNRALYNETCNSTSASVLQPNTTTSLDECAYLLALPDVEVVVRLLQPYFAMYSAIAFYTILILGISARRSLKRIVKCIEQGNAFVERYLEVKEKTAKAKKATEEARRRAKEKSQTSPCQNCGHSVSAGLSAPCRCQCHVAAVKTYHRSLSHSVGDTLWSLTFPRPGKYLPLSQTLKPTTTWGWLRKALTLVFSVHIPLLLLVPGFLPLLLAGPRPGAFREYAAHVFFASLCVWSIGSFTRRLLKQDEFIEGMGANLRLTGDTNNMETRVTVPWVCARMWAGMGGDWEDMEDSWRDCVREEVMMEQLQKRMVVMKNVERERKAEDGYSDIDKRNTSDMV